jgi:tetratricopeptide (TPR) repeat protein
MNPRIPWCVLLGPALALAGCTAATKPQADSTKIPITTTSDEARRLYLEGRDLAERLRAAEAQERFRGATALDDGFALAWYGQALSAQSTKEFWDALSRATALAGQVSDGERLMILALDAGARSDLPTQSRLLRQLTEDFPEDQRAWGLLGNYHFARQDYTEAIAAYERAIAIAPEYSPPYNQLGYARRFLGDYQRAEDAFRKYIELIPDDPNPYDSYAELLMKMGRFEDSIANYEKALEQDPHFAASYAGIGLDQIYLGDPEKGRASFEKLEAGARTIGERRLALLRIAESWVFEGETDKALETIEAMSTLSEEEGDKATVAGDLNLMGNVLLEAGRPDEALARFEKAMAVNEESDTPEEAKEAFRRNATFNTARAALESGDLESASGQAEGYAAAAATSGIPFERRQSHHLLGLVALANKHPEEALAELRQANQQDPRVQYLLALAYAAQGEPKLSREACRRAAEDNSLNFAYAYVRDKARRMLDQS